MLLSIFASLALPLAASQTVPLSPGPGVEIFLGSDYRCDYWRLINYFETQLTNSYCSIASSVMVLNALGIEKPFVKRLGFSLFTQENFFTEKVQKTANRTSVLKRGMTLDQLAEVLQTFPIQVAVFHAPDLTLEKFRSLLETTLIQEDAFLISNYYRPAIGQDGGGHFSPLGAYNKKRDQVLVLDVSRYKYPPFWVAVEDFYKSLQAVDPDSGLSRGVIVISR